MRRATVGAMMAIAYLSSTASTAAEGKDPAPLELVCEGTLTLSDPLMVRYLGYTSKKDRVRIKALLDADEPRVWIDGFDPRLTPGSAWFGLSTPYAVVRLGEVFQHSSSVDSGTSAKEGNEQTSFFIRLDRRTGELELVDSVTTTRIGGPQAFTVDVSKIAGSYVCEKRGPNKF